MIHWQVINTFKKLVFFKVLYWLATMSPPDKTLNTCCVNTFAWNATELTNPWHNTLNEYCFFNYYFVIYCQGSSGLALNYSTDFPCKQSCRLNSWREAIQGQNYAVFNVGHTDPWTHSLASAEVRSDAVWRVGRWLIPDLPSVRLGRGLVVSW